MTRSLKFLLVCTFLFQGARSQEYNFQKFTLDEGLNASYIYQINQSKNGEILLATENGLVLFDGYSFRNKTVENGLSENLITTVFPTSQNKIILGHFQEGLTFGRDNSYNAFSSQELSLPKVNPSWKCPSIILF